MPTTLCGANITDFNIEKVKKLQRIENSEGKKILGASTYTHEEEIKGDTGISDMKERIMEIMEIMHTLRGACTTFWKGWLRN